MPCIFPSLLLIVYRRFFPPGVSVLGMKLTIEYEDLVLRLRMIGFALVLLSEYARVVPLLPVYTFMAWTFTILQFLLVQQYLSMLHSLRIQILGYSCWFCYLLLIQFWPFTLYHKLLFISKTNGSLLSDWKFRRALHFQIHKVFMYGWYILCRWHSKLLPP